MARANIELLGNINYCATVVEINNKKDLIGCDNIQSTNIFGCNVIISKDTVIGTLGLYFPVETKLSAEFLAHNNLFRDKTLNRDKTKGGFFELNGRIRAVKLRGNASDGFFIPLTSLIGLLTSTTLEEFVVGLSFDTINGNKLCEKYTVLTKSQGISTGKQKKAVKNTSTIVENQFRFHIDTPQLGKNIHVINPNDLISITTKIHGSSFIVSKLLCNRKLSKFEKLLKWLKVNIVTSEYKDVFASRKVIKSESNKNVGFYSENIWATVNKELNEFLMDGMTIYGEVAGFLDSGKYIQKDYDYACESFKHKNFIYRITHTDVKGNVFEYSMKQVQDWCKQKGLNAVPELYYGYAKDLFNIDTFDITTWQNEFLNKLVEVYLEKPCTICKNSVPDEGIVLRIEDLGINVFKLKSFAFKAYETKQLDSGEVDIESVESEDGEK